MFFVYFANRYSSFAHISNIVPFSIFIVDNYNPENDIIMGQYLRTYYLKDLEGNVTIISMLNNKLYSYDQFQEDLEKYGNGWITWETRKGYHIRKDIKNYIGKNFVKYHGSGVDNTKIEVYYFNRDMLDKS